MEFLRSTMKDTISRLEATKPLRTTAQPGMLPLGIEFVLWGCEVETSVAVIREFRPAAVWLFAATRTEDYGVWARRIREATKGETKIWIRIASVKETMDFMNVSEPDVLIAQGTGAGGHGMKRSASIVSLVPELRDALNQNGHESTTLLAAGGIADGRGTAAALLLRADGVVIGTRFLASMEAQVTDGYRAEILKAQDGGLSTIRSRLFDRVKETNGWPSGYDGRAFLNTTYTDAEKGMSDEESIKLHKEALLNDDTEGEEGARTVRYVGTGVSLIHEILPARDIVHSIVSDVQQRLWKANETYTAGDSLGPRL